jgi:hypothetical protein
VTDILIGLFLFGCLVLAALCFVLVMFHIRTQRELQTYLQEIVENQADGFSKLLQTALIHLRSPTPEQAVQLQSVLEREQHILNQTATALENQIAADAKEPALPARRVVGYRGTDGHEYRFKTTPPAHFLTGIDKSRLVYSDEPV